MRAVWSVCCLLVLSVGMAPGASGAPSGALVTLTDVAHALDGSVLVITGLLENRGPAVAGFLIDATGFSAQGDEVAAGSDGIPWKVRSGGIERFTIRLVVSERLIRDYVVTAAYAKPPYTAMASARRGVDFALYRSLILSRVQVRAELVGGWLVVRNLADRLPVAQITAEVTLLLPFRKTFVVQTITLTIPADGTATAFVGFPGAVLVSTRVTEVLLKTTWSD